MAAHVEVERKYELGDAPAVPALTDMPSVARVGEPVESDLEATYFDTPDLRLARRGITLRSRTGGHDAGWHLKLPRSGDERLELQLPPNGHEHQVPDELLGMVRGRIGVQPLDPVATLRTTRIERTLFDAAGRRLATLADDHVHARRSKQGSVELLEWREIEVELEDGSPEVLDELDERFRRAGLRTAEAPSKLLRVLGDDVRRPVPEAPTKAAACLLDHLTAQVDAIASGDGRVRRDDPEAVHDMRVGTRRLRSALATFRPFLDQRRTERLRDELRWLGEELGRLRDSEVIAARLTSIVHEEPPELVLGPVLARIERETRTRRREAREALLDVLEGDRHFELLEDLHELVADPPWAPEPRPTRSSIRRRVAKAFRRMDDRADAVPSEAGPDRDHALHELRKAAKRARYAAEAVAPLFGGDAERAAARAEDLQDRLGLHQDTVQSREVLRQLGVTAHLSGENGFTFGLLLAAERQRAADAEAGVDDVIRRSRTRKARAWMG